MSVISRASGLVVLSMMLGGCTWVSQKIHQHDNDYVKQSQSVATTKIPAGVKTEKMTPYYPVPAESKVVPQSEPSIVPPGSHLSDYKKTSLQQARLVTLAGGQEAVLLAEPKAKAWVKMAQALKTAGYTVLDQDQGMGAYFVLDKAQTDNKVSKKTPIVRINLAQKPQATEVTVTAQDNKPLALEVDHRIMRALVKQLG